MAQTPVVVTAEPAEALIYVDGEPAGQAPLELSLAPGTHRVRAWKRGYDAREQNIRVTSRDSVVRVQFTLPPVSGRIRVQGVSPEAIVLVDGAPLDENAALPEGSVVVTVDDGSMRTMALVEVRAESETVISYSTRGFDPSVMTRGALVPGGAQFFGGRPRAGAVFVAGMGASALLGVGFDRRAQKADQDFEDAVVLYDEAGSEREVDAALVEIDAALGRSVRNRQFRTAAFVGVLVVYVGSLVDAGLNHGSIGSLRVKGIEPTRVSLAPTASGVALRLSL